MEPFKQILLKSESNIDYCPKAVYVEHLFFKGWWYYVYHIEPLTATIYINRLKNFVPYWWASVTNIIEKVAFNIYKQEYQDRQIKPSDKLKFVYYINLWFGTSIVIRQGVKLTPLFKNKKLVRFKNPRREPWSSLLVLSSSDHRFDDEPNDAQSIYQPL